MFKNILLATDFSQHAITARNAALAMARGTRGKLTILHVYDKHQLMLDEGVLMASEFVEQSEDRRFKMMIRDNMDEFLKPVIDSGIEFHEVVEQGKASKVIVRKAQEINADLIVIGSHSKRGFVDVSLGGVSRRVGENAPCPVLIVTNYKETEDPEVSGDKSESDEAEKPSKGSEPATDGESKEKPDREDEASGKVDSGETGENQD